MIKLTKIRLINWHYLSNETIEVKNNILLTGQNASGKSTILDAITYILTGGDTNFNLAANEKGKRDLKGYVKCKLGAEDKEYLREGDVSGHICLEFYNESTNTSFIVGAVIDAFGDIGPAKSMLYRGNCVIDDSIFISPDRRIYSIMEFKKNNKDFELYQSKQEAKRGFRNAFGSINEDYFKLIVKALAFKPISNVKEFIYQNILEEKEIDVTSIKDSIRSYKELETTLNLIKQKIADLREINAAYETIMEFEEKKNYFEYLMKLFDLEKIKSDIETTNKNIMILEEKKDLKEKELTGLDEEKQELEERKNELYNILSSSEDFKAEEYISKQLDKSTKQYEAVKDSLNKYVKKAAELKDSVNELRKINNKKIYAELANLPLSSVSTFDSEKTKLSLIDIETRLENDVELLNQEKGTLQKEKQQVIEELSDISNSLKGLQNNRLNYDPKLLALRNDIALGLKNIYGFDISVHFFAELIEITDKKWADTIEVFLRNRRFAMIVEPKYYDTALSILARIKNKYNVYNTSLVNTKKIGKFTTYEKNSLASIMTCENVDAEHYKNFICGSVIMCDSERELENYNTAITNDYLLYSGYAVSVLNDKISKPFIGANALASQTEQLNLAATEKKDEFYAITNKIASIDSELSIIKSLDFKSLINELDNALQAQSLSEKIKDLEKQKKNASALGVSDVKSDYNKILASIQNIEDRKVEINQEIGGIRISVGQATEAVETLKANVEETKLELNELAKNNILIENQAKDEYDRISKEANPQRQIEEYRNKLKNEEALYQNQCDALLSKQFSYTQKYNSTLSVGLSEVKKFLNELDKLEKSELIKYENKVRSAREAAEIVFKEDFLSKLRNNILSAEQEISKINETLSTIKFGNDSYEFIFPKSSEYAEFYDMVTNKEALKGDSLFTVDFQIKYEQQLDELFTSLSQDELNSNGVINKFTDYRTYMDYDIKITNTALNQTMLYSKVFKSRSGGETQVPFYVAIIAAFVRIFQNNKIGVKDTIGLVMFDEVFDKMDFPRMRAMMKFISSMPIQLILACPQSAERIEVLEEYTNTTLIMVRQGSKAQALSKINKEELIINDEEEIELEDESFEEVE
ncbi:MAG: ATP-binding protein [Anaeroplasmataceae bacterium]